MAKKSSTTRIVLAGTPVDVTLERVPLASLRLDPDNPRVRLQLTVGGRRKPATPAQLLDLMREQDGYSKLQKQIRQQNGIADPLMIRHDGRIVEGNTRFAVVSTLVKTVDGPEKWGMVPVIRLPKDVPEKAIQLQMAGYHIAGKTNWRPSAQADQIYRLINEADATIEEVAEATRMNPKKVQQYIDAYEYLIHEVVPEHKGASVAEKQEILDNRFSHALQLMTVRALKSVREDKKKRKWLAEQIAHNKLTGQEVRKIHSIIDNPQARAAMEREGFKSAKRVLQAENPANDSKVLSAITKVTESLNNLDQKDLQLFRKHGNSRAALEALVEAARNVLAMTKENRRRA